MEYIALLLSIIVITLSAVPCCGGEHEAMELSTLKQQNTSHHSTRDEDDCCKNCSPFYSCGTCVGFVRSSIFVLNTTIFPNNYQVHFPAYLQASQQVFTTQIWQPPKLS